MKKIIALFALAIGLAANASTVSWGLSSAVDTTTFASGTAYLVFTTGDAITSFDTTGLTTFSISGVLRATDTQVATGTVSAGLIQADDATFSASTGNGKTFYTVIISSDEENMMISSLASTRINAASSHSTSLSWSAAEMGSVYTIPVTPPTPVVPEPTSGLLVLLGMAGLALRRKRA